MAQRVLTFPTLTDDWLLSVWAAMLDWLLALDLCMTGRAVCTSLWPEPQPLCFGKSFSRFPSSLSPPFSLSLSLHPADKGPPAGPHGEGRLAGPSDLQRDRDDQRGELGLSLSSYTGWKMEPFLATCPSKPFLHVCFCRVRNAALTSCTSWWSFLVSKQMTRSTVLFIMKRYFDIYKHYDMIYHK